MGLLRQQGGQDLVEYALALPVFLLLVLGVVEFAIVIWSYDTIAFAAREGARSGIVYPYDLDEVETTVRARALGLNQDALYVSAAQVTNTIRVTVTYSLTLVTGFIQAPIQFGTVATMRIE